MLGAFVTGAIVASLAWALILAGLDARRVYRRRSGSLKGRG